MQKIKVIFFLGLIMFFGIINSVSAATLTVGGGWQYFTWGEGQPAATSPSPWDFTLSQAGLLKVTDAFLTGDRFKIEDGATTLGYTSLVATTTTMTDYIDFAFSDPRWSSGQWSLPSGAHSIIITATQNPWGSGGAYLRVDSPVIPEPATLSLLGLGLLGILVRKRRVR